MDLSLEPDRKSKAGVLLAATELYVARDRHDAAERRIFSELFRQLLPDTPTDHRRMIATLLSGYEHTPADCLSQLAADADAGVAARALSSSGQLAETDLLAGAARGDETVRRAIAGRSGMPARVAGVLLRHADAETLKVLIARPDCPLDDEALAILADRPQVLAALAPELASRRALPAPLLFALFLDLDPAGRMEAIAAAEARALGELARKGDPRVLNAAFKPAVLKSLVDAALSGGVAVFAAHLAYTLALSGDTAARLVDDGGGEALVVALRALGTGDSESGRILVRLLGQSVSLDRLRQLISLHDRITPRAAMLLVEGLRAGIPTPTARPAASGIASPFGGV
ncbi:DUF2336 domain-containing protein, partial [Stappia sp.]|uniref:DUF2336 domain-containing protein n=1 Tax=Stappia sp. TaxID=1870903 RepID=UPI003A9962AD